MKDCFKMRPFKKISDWWQYFKQTHHIVNSGVDSSFVAPVSQDNARDIETKKRVARAFKLQQGQMQARALKPHDPSCLDPLTCNKKNCFNRVADKIVATSIVSVEEVKGDIKRRRRNKATSDDIV